MARNDFTKRNHQNGIPAQAILDSGMNVFGLELFIESYTDRPDDKIIPLDFVFRGIRIRLEKAAEQGVQSDATPSQSINPSDQSA